MDKHFLKSFLVGIAVLVIILSLYFVLADGIIGQVTGLYFTENTSTNYDKEGIFALNWTADTNATSYNITIYADGSEYIEEVNDSITGYSFNNQTDANYTFNVAAVNSTGKGTVSANISIEVDDTYPQIDTAYPLNASYATPPTQFNFTYTETNCENAWFSNDTGLTNYSVQTCGDNFTGMVAVEGGNNWTVYVNDSAGNENSSIVYFTLDTTDPIATLGINPVANLNRSNSSTTFDIKCSDNLGPISHAKLYGNWSGGWHANYTNTSFINNSWFNTTVTGISDGIYLWGVYCNDSAGNSNWTTNRTLTIDTTAPVITLPHYTNATLKKNTEQLTLNISVSDATAGLESNCLIDANGTSNQTVAVSNGWCNSSAINLTGFIDGNHTLNIWINDSAGNFKLNDSYAVQIDTTSPSVSLPSSSSTRTSLTISISGAEGTCTADRSGASISGSTLTETDLSCGSSYAYVVTCTDSAGNAGSSSSTSFSTSGCGGGSSTTTLPKEIHSWTKIIPGVASIMKDFDKEIGIKQIQIEVNNEAQNVKITVTKHEGKPAEVSVEKSGKIYRYLHINAENLEGKLERAVIRMQVEKSWMVANDFEIDNMAMFKFNENNNVWDELNTVYVEADNDYYYYDAEVDSFSYFAISEKVIVDAGDDGLGDTGTTSDEEKERNLTWLWILIVVVVLAIIIGVVKVIKKKQQNI